MGLLLAAELHKFGKGGLGAQEGAASAGRDAGRSRGANSPGWCGRSTRLFDVTPCAAGAGSIIMLEGRSAPRMALFKQVAQLAEEMAATASRLKKRAAIAHAISAAHAAAPGTDDAGLFALYLAGTPF